MVVGSSMRTRPATSVLENDVGRDRSDTRQASERERDHNLTLNLPEDVPDAGSTTSRERVDPASANHHRPRARSNRLHHVLAAVDTSVHHDLETITNSIGDARQR